MRPLVKPLAIAAAAGMFLVLVMGATVTNTGSAEGCGRHWPLCNGQFIPEFAVATLIEFSHRAVTGVEGFLVLGLAMGAWALYRQHREVQVLSPLMVSTLFLQAGMGAWAVLYPQTPLVLATHFGISLLCFASTVLLAAFILQSHSQAAWRSQPISSGYRRAVWALTIFTLVVVYVGAYVRHSNAQMACVDWPLCNGSIFPGFAGPVGVVFAHRLLALATLIGCVALFARSRALRATRPDLYWGSLAAVVFVVAQSLSGAVVVFTRMELFSALLHAALVSLLFAALSYLCLTTTPRREPIAAPNLRLIPSPGGPSGRGP